MSRINLKDVEIKELKEKNHQVQKQIKILQEKVSNLQLEIKGARSIAGRKPFPMGFINR